MAMSSALEHCKKNFLISLIDLIDLIDPQAFQLTRQRIDKLKSQALFSYRSMSPAFSGNVHSSRLVNAEGTRFLLLRTVIDLTLSGL